MWIPNDTRFNENMASFVAQILTEKWMLKWGLHEEIENYKSYRKDKVLYKEWAKRFRRELELFYSQKPVDFAKKEKLFLDWTQRRKPNFAKIDFISKKKWNNATLQVVSLYDSQEQDFSNAYKCYGNEQSIVSFLEELKLAHQKFPDDSALALSWICEKGSGR